MGAWVTLKTITRRRKWTRAIVGGVAAWGLCVCCVTASSAAADDAQPPEPGTRAASNTTVWAGVYNAAQAKRGESLSVQKCVICHGEELLGNEAPGLVGPDFIIHWNTQTVWDLLDRIK